MASVTRAAPSRPASCAPCPGADPNIRDASRMLMPSTITARRTRRYTSTLYIRRTIRRVGYGPYGWRRVVQFATAVCQQLPARTAHFTPAPYICGKQCCRVQERVALVSPSRSISAVFQQEGDNLGPGSRPQRKDHDLRGLVVQCYLDFRSVLQQQFNNLRSGLYESVSIIVPNKRTELYSRNRPWLRRLRRVPATTGLFRRSPRESRGRPLNPV